MQTPDVPLTLKNCKMLGFDNDIENAHYYIAHESVIRRQKDSAMGPVPFAIYAFMARLASRAPDFFRIPQDELSEVGFRVDI